MEQDSDIFARHDETEHILKKSQIKKNIPASAVKEPDANLHKTHAEWRWRWLNINGKELVEISCRKTNGVRKYFDKFGDWVEYDVSEEYNKYVIDTYYYYAMEESD